MKQDSLSTLRHYIAFISYRHADNSAEGRRWAEWLQTSLERYEMPRDLIGLENHHGGKVPAALYPIFRDEVELAAGAHLTDSIRKALENSDFLIVICSPRACESAYVDEEIRIFKELGKEDRILALIIEGAPHHAQFECFPPSLKMGRRGADGRIDWSLPEEPIAADVRPGKRLEQGYTSAAAYAAALTQEGKISAKKIREASRDYNKLLHHAFLKILAGIAGLERGKFEERDAAYRLARLKRLVLTFGLLATVALVAGIMAFFQARRAENEATNAIEATELATRRLAQAEQARDAAQNLVSNAVFGLRKKLAPIGKIALLEDLATAAEEYYRNLPAELTSGASRRHEASLALNRALISGLSCDDPTTEEMLSRSLKILRALPPVFSEDIYDHDHLLGLLGLGFLYFETGRINEIKALAVEANALADRGLLERPKSPVAFKSKLAALALELLSVLRTSKGTSVKEAAPIFAKTKSVSDQLKEIEGPSFETDLVDASSMFLQGMVLVRAKQSQMAVPILQSAAALLDKAAKTYSTHPLLMELVLTSRANLLNVLEQQAVIANDTAVIQELSQQHLALISEYERLTELEPLRLQWWSKLAHHRMGVGYVLAFLSQSPADNEKGIKLLQGAFEASTRSLNPRYTRSNFLNLHHDARSGFLRVLRTLKPEGWREDSIALIKKILGEFAETGPLPHHTAHGASDDTYLLECMSDWCEVANEPKTTSVELDDAVALLSKVLPRWTTHAQENLKSSLRAVEELQRWGETLARHKHPAAATFKAESERMSALVQQRFYDHPELRKQRLVKKENEIWQALNAAKSSSAENKPAAFAKVEAMIAETMPTLLEQADSLPDGIGNALKCKIWNWLGTVFMETQKWADAEAPLRESIAAGLISCEGAEPITDKVHRRCEAADAGKNLGIIMFRLGRTEEGMALHRTHLGTLEEITKAAPTLSRWYELATHWQQCGDFLPPEKADLKFECTQKNVAALRQIATLARRDHKLFSPDTSKLHEARHRLCAALLAAGKQLRSEEKTKEAHTLFTEALEFAVVSRDEGAPEHQGPACVLAARLKHALSECLLTQDRVTEAKAELEEANQWVAEAEHLLGGGHADCASARSEQEALAKKFPPEPPPAEPPSGGISEE